MSPPDHADRPRREQLLYQLHEAAEIEHLLMCCYLYAALSLKVDDPAWTAGQREAVARWRASLLAVALDEMTHLALVANLAQSLGGSAWFGRPPYPVDAGPYPAGFVIRLQPFSQATVEHFKFLERPQSKELEPASGFEPTAVYQRNAPLQRLSPGARDYATVGELYESLRAGLASWVQREGEAAVFVGDPALQVDAQLAPLRGLRSVQGWADAQAALDTIVTQGEGAGDEAPDSHFSRFARMADELADQVRADPGFCPAWPVAANPVMNAPIHSAGARVHVNQATAAAWLDLGNALYTASLRCLMQGFASRVREAKAVWLSASFALMREIVPVGQALATQPACEGAEVHAGLSFTPLRPLGVLPETTAGAVMAERLGEIRARLGQPLCVKAPFADALGGELPRLQARLAQLAQQSPRSAPLLDGAPVAPGVAAPRTPMSEVQAAPAAVEAAAGRQITILFDAARCIHARHCVLEAPLSFKANTPGNWIDPDAMPVEDLVMVARRCPSGAIRYQRHDGGLEEAPPPVNLLRVREHGPYALNAPFTLPDGSSGLRATLCRCGQSGRKPWCDGSHAGAGFQATGEPATRADEPLAERAGMVHLRPRLDGPLELQGALEICGGTGRTVARGTVFRLCRCGQSQNKPFCDGSHRVHGFVAQGT